MTETTEKNVSAKTLNGASSKKTLNVITLIVALFVIVCLVAGIFAYVNQGKSTPLSFIPTEIVKNPDERIKESFDQYIDESIKTVDKTDFNNLSIDSLFSNSKGEESVIGLKAKTDDNNNGIAIDLNLKADKETKRLGLDSKLNIALSIDSTKVEFKDINLSAIVADNKGYVQLKKFPTELLSLTGFDSSMQDTFKNNVIGQWISIDPNVLKENGMDLSKSLKSGSSNISKDDVKKILEEAKKYKFYKNSKLVGRETINGYSTIHYKSELNLDELKNFTKSIPSKISGNISESDSKQIDELYDNLKEAISSHSVDIYLGVSDNYLYKEVYSFNLKKDATITKGLKSDLKLEFSIETKQKDQSQKIDVPSNSKDIIEVVKSFAQYYSL